MPPKSTVRDLRRHNRERVLRQLYFEAPTSRLDLSRTTELSPATVTNLIGELIDEGVVIEAGVGESEGGRPRTMLTINPKVGYFVGVDVGETSVRVELFDLALRSRASAEQTLSSQVTRPEQIVQAIAEGVEAVLRQAGAGRGQVIGVGVGVPGLVDIDTGVSIFAPNWGWRNVPLLAMLSRQLGLPVYLDNGAKTMAQAEQWFGAGKGADHLAVLLIGTGVGASIMINGQLYRGATNSAGEWGHTVVERRGQACRCGSRGCLEAYVGAPGIIARLQGQGDAAAPAPAGQREAIRQLAEAVRQGDAHATSVLDETAEYLGVGIGNLINLCNPQRILIGGWVGVALGPLLLPRLAGPVERNALAAPFQQTEIALCQLGEETVCTGAATLVLDAFFSLARRQPFGAQPPAERAALRLPT